MDGARFANAVAALDVHPCETRWRTGVDVLCFGGTRNGLPVGEAVVFFDRPLADNFPYRLKQAGQLASKMRFIFAPWLGLLDHGVWLRNARHANAMARLRQTRLQEIAGVSIMFPSGSNACLHSCRRLPRKRYARGCKFYEFIGARGRRLTCAWDTQPEAAERFAADVREFCAA